MKFQITLSDAERQGLLALEATDKDKFNTILGYSLKTVTSKRINSKNELILKFDTLLDLTLFTTNYNSLQVFSTIKTFTIHADNS